MAIDTNIFETGSALLFAFNKTMFEHILLFHKTRIDFIFEMIKKSEAIDFIALTKHYKDELEFLTDLITKIDAINNKTKEFKDNGST